MPWREGVVRSLRIGVEVSGRGLAHRFLSGRAFPRSVKMRDRSGRVAEKDWFREGESRAPDIWGRLE